MHTENTTLAGAGIEEKFVIGPTAPKPGPTLPMVAATADIEEIRSTPIEVTNNTEDAIINKYKKKKVWTLSMTSWETIFLPIRSGMTA